MQNNREELLNQEKNWAYLAELPAAANDFLLDKHMALEGDKLILFSYGSPGRRKKLEAYYNIATKDYMLKKYFGLNEYCDIRFITPLRAAFENLLRQDLLCCIEEMSQGRAGKTGLIILGKGLPDWEYGDILPDRIGDFELYVRPREPVRLINGAVIVIDYSDFAGGRQLVVYYNELRDEFYAEKKLGGVVETTALFDARDLKELEKALAARLEGVLLHFAGYSR